MATSSNSAQDTSSQKSQGATRHTNDMGAEAALGIGKNGKRLNANATDLQERVEVVRDKFLGIRSIYIGRERHDVARNGLLGEVVARTPIFVYDLPELKDHCSTAFVDMSGKIYIADTFARRLLAEHDAGLDSLNFLIRHEGDHLRRMHLSRMLDLPHEIANIAQDIRINIDLAKGEAGERFSEQSGRSPSGNEIAGAVRAYLQEMSATAMSIGWAMTYDEHAKYDGLSEEAIGTLLLKDWKEPPRIPNREVSFADIMEGAAQEADHVKVQLQNGVSLTPTAPAYVMTPAELSGLAADLRKVGQAKANPSVVSNQDLQLCLDRMNKLREHQGLVELDLQHSLASVAIAGKGTVHLSGKTGDAYLDALAPSERVKMAVNILEKILNPSNTAGGIPPGPQNGGLTVKDLERSMGRGKGPSAPKPNDGQKKPGQPDEPGADEPSENAESVPAPNVYHNQDHVMDTEDLIKIMKDAGVDNSTLEKLGYDDLGKLAEEVKSTKDSVVSAINKASEDQMRVGERYPGGHMLNYAKAQMLDFFKPVITWQMTIKKIMDSMGKGQRYDSTEPWMMYHVDAADMGFKNQRDVPFMGSMVPGRVLKPLVLNLYDTSGSVDDAMLKRFYTEGVNMSRKMSRGTAPDVIHVAADTIARGEAQYITEQNYKQTLKKGINYGGRGGTNFQASLEAACELMRPTGKKTPYTGRSLEAIFYYTDTGDAAPDFARLLKKAHECGMKKLPTIVFIAPKSCFNDAFNKDIKGRATIVYFDNKERTHINVDAISLEQVAKPKIKVSP